MTYSLISFVHFCELVHVLEVDVDLYDLFPRGTRGSENFAEVGDALSLGYRQLSPVVSTKVSQCAP